MLVALLPLILVTQHAVTPTEWKPVDQALGRSGAMQPGGVYRVSFPRGDLKVTAAGVSVRPALALGSWVAFKRTSDSAAIMTGDLVLLDSEIGPVIDALQRVGIEQTALHHHILHESPHVLYMHVMGRGQAAKLAADVRAALAVTKTPLAAPTNAPAPAAINLDTAQIAQILGVHGRVNGGVYQIGVPRAETITVDSAEVPPAMGVATAINFQPTGGGKAAITGDFVLIAAEVNPVIQALRANSIEVTSLHSHMLTESPRLFFMHFWANDDALKLARGLAAALGTMNVRKGP